MIVQIIFISKIASTDNYLQSRKYWHI